MRRQSARGEGKIRQSLFPATLFWVYFVTLLLMSGFHEGLLVLAEARQWPDWVTVNVPLALLGGGGGVSHALHPV